MTPDQVVQEAGEKTELGLGEYIVHHIKNSNEWNIFGYHLHLPTFKPVHILGTQVDFSITQHLVMMWVTSIILIVALGLLFRKKRLVPSGIAAMMEVLVLFVRDEIAIPNMGAKAGKKFTPFL
ncbi:MAG: hypothetical protein P8184_19405, partial [Calditrichia bacterium]